MKENLNTANENCFQNWVPKLPVTRKQRCEVNFAAKPRKVSITFLGQILCFRFVKDHTFSDFFAFLSDVFVFLKYYF